MFVNKPLQSTTTMAIEITFGVRGKETTQALFIQESEWETPLSKLRKIIEEQSLYVPLEYKFLTLKNNAIPNPAEENIVLKEIVCFSTDGKDEADLKLEDFGIKGEIGEAAVKSLEIPKIWITPLKVTFSSASPNSGRQSSGASTESSPDDGEWTPDTGGERQGESDPLQGDGTEENSQQNSQRPNCLFCPYKAFKNFLHGRTAPPDSKTIVKVLFLLTCLLFIVLATLTLSVHLMMTTVIGMSTSTGMADLMSSMAGGGGHSDPTLSNTVTKLQVKLSQLETSSKYEIDQLTSRLAELEDLYLRDLAVHKKELNLLKKRMSQEDQEELVTDLDMEDFEEGTRIFDYDFDERSSGSSNNNNKDAKRRPMGGKINDRNKG